MKIRQKIYVNRRQNGGCTHTLKTAPCRAGMPECVMQFAETRDYILVRRTLETILMSYLNDMSKYNNLNEIKKTRIAYDSITVQLSKKNTRFQYKSIKKPVKNYRDIDTLKIYVSDLGLLCTRKDLAEVYMDTYNPDYAIKLSAKNFGFKNGKKTVSLYAAFCI